MNWKRLADASAPSLVLLSLLFSFLKFHRYPLWRPEVLLCSVLLVSLGTCLYGLAKLRPETLYPLLLGLLVIAFFDVRFLVISHFVLAVARISPLASPALLLLAFFAFMWLAFAVRSELGRIVSAAWAVILLTTILLPAGRIAAGAIMESPDANRLNLPPILHLVLDEQIGVEGIPTGVPGGADLQRDLTSLLLKNGFSVYRNAFSHYSESQFSLASLLNGEVFDSSVEYIRSEPTGYSIRRNDWLRSLAEDGYAIRVYQSGWIDFCSADGFRPEYCFVYPANSVGSLLEFDLGTFDKARLILPRVFKGSIDIFPFHEPQLSSLSTLRTLEKIGRDIRDGAKGTVFFAHLLLPHYSYVFDAQCRVRENIASWANVGDLSPAYSEFNTERERTEKYLLYFQQVRCLMKKLDNLFEQMKEDGLLERATIVVHGDHGSRLATKSFRLIDPAELTTRDMIDHFSTLFAIRLPDNPGGCISEKASIQEIFAKLLLDRPLKAPTEDVIMRRSSSGDKMFLRRPMPELGGNRLETQGSGKLKREVR